VSIVLFEFSRDIYSGKVPRAVDAGTENVFLGMIDLSKFAEELECVTAWWYD